MKVIFICACLLALSFAFPDPPRNSRSGKGIRRIINMPLKQQQRVAQYPPRNLRAGRGTGTFSNIPAKQRPQIFQRPAQLIQNEDDSTEQNESGETRRRFPFRMIAGQLRSRQRPDIKRLRSRLMARLRAGLRPVAIRMTVDASQNGTALQNDTKGIDTAAGTGRTNVDDDDDPEELEEDDIEIEEDDTESPTQTSGNGAAYVGEGRGDRFSRNHGNNIHLRKLYRKRIGIGSGDGMSNIDINGASGDFGETGIDTSGDGPGITNVNETDAAADKKKNVQGNDDDIDDENETASKERMPQGHNIGADDDNEFDPEDDANENVEELEENDIDIEPTTTLSDLNLEFWTTDSSYLQTDYIIYSELHTTDSSPLQTHNAVDAEHQSIDRTPLRDDNIINTKESRKTVISANDQNTIKYSENDVDSFFIDKNRHNYLKSNSSVQGVKSDNITSVLKTHQLITKIQK
ncbi:uncharacterized protein LOC122793399 [Protopterus annectens]|uniref:uncharacterized protein LOC122793399 n=1 Tax=Protopterus annectens TaxID=7888 RepID=UPI001CFBD09B|nr:uncharacterized protein LOC122793399 [Protopterus annectens]